MSNEREQVIATLAAGIIVARSAKTVPEISQAWTDAGYILHPRPSDQAYKDWQTVNGMTPTTPEEDAARKERRTEASGALGRRMAGYTGR